MGLVLAKKLYPTFISSLLGGEKSNFGPFRPVFGHLNPIYFAVRHKRWPQISPGVHDNMVDAIVADLGEER